MLIVQAKELRLENATEQCLLLMKDMSDRNNDGSPVYGFITTGELWQMI